MRRKYDVFRVVFTVFIWKFSSFPAVNICRCTKTTEFSFVFLCCLFVWSSSALHHLFYSFESVCCLFLACRYAAVVIFVQPIISTECRIDRYWIRNQRIQTTYLWSLTMSVNAISPINSTIISVVRSSVLRKPKILHINQSNRPSL